jgi:hypothetical protein
MKKIRINLLAQKEADFPKKFSYFLYHYLRYVIVITAIVVICVFFYRYTIDQKVIDLKEKVYSMEAIMKATQSQVTRFEAVAQKTKEIAVRIEDQKAFADNVNYVLSIVPQKIILKEFQFINRTIIMNGISSDYATIKVFHSRLQKEVKFNDVNIKFKSASIDKIAKTVLGFEFTISIKI